MFLIKDEEPAESFWWLKESDFISLFNQFPMTSVFQYILGIDSTESGMSPSLGSSGVLNFPQSFKESSSVHIENQVEAMR